MKSILLIGLGRFGRHIARTLNELGHEILGIDSNEERVNKALPYLTNALIGDCTNDDFVATLGVDNFDTCIVTIGDNFQNSLITTTILKDFGAKYVVSRASRDIHERLLLRNGADEVVYPEKQLARWTAIKYSSKHIADYIEIDEGYAIVEMTVPSSWVGKSVKQIDIRKNYNLNIAGVKTHGKIKAGVMPDTVFAEGDILLVMGSDEDIKICEKLK